MIPIWFYARYRARRYVLGRTRWRGVRFGLEPGAWGYAGRALWYWVLTIISLGILWPRMTFLLEKYRTDRTFFGSAKLQQGGRWQMLYRAALPIATAVAASLLLGAWLYFLSPILKPDTYLTEQGWVDLFAWWIEGRGTLTPLEDPWRLWLVPLCLSAVLYGAIHYRWSAKRIMANHKSADGVTFASGIKAPRVTMVYVLGMFISYLVLLIGITLLVLLIMMLWGYEAFVGNDGGVLSDLPRWIGYSLIAVMYLGVFLLWGVLHNTFVTYPLMRHMAVTTSLPNTIGLPAISQRERDVFAEAEGFAEALDLGAAI